VTLAAGLGITTLRAHPTSAQQLTSFVYPIGDMANTACMGSNRLPLSRQLQPLYLL